MEAVLLSNPVATTPAAAPLEAVEAARLWQAGWALAAVAGAGLLLVIFGGLPPRAGVALAVAAAPGAVGWFWSPAGEQRYALLALWAVAVAVAAELAGGLTGPLAIWCAAPLLLGMLLRAVTAGALLSAAAVLALMVTQAAGGVPAPSNNGAGVGLAVVALALLIGAAAGAAWQLRRPAPSTAPETFEPEPAAEPPPPPRIMVPRPPSAEPPVESERIRELENRLAAAEIARMEAEAAASAKARFLANMSHELRTPLNAIMGFSDIMRARMFGELAPKYGEYAELIHESGRHLIDLINDVLDMSKIEADRYVLSREAFDARDAVNAALRLTRLQADEAGIQLRGLLPSQPVPVDADRRALKQIVLNLLSNALKFTPHEGSVTVTLQPRGGELELVVADTGPGIPAEDLERLGRPFEQAGDAAQRRQGTGLGLSLVKALAGLHGGDMSIESALGEGTAVTVRLPVLATPAKPEPTSGGTVIPLPNTRQS